MNRRSLLKAFAATAAGVLIPDQALALPEPERRYWALDRTMLASNPPLVRAGETVMVAWSPSPLVATLTLYVHGSPQHQIPLVELPSGMWSAKAPYTLTAGAAYDYCITYRGVNESPSQMLEST